MRGAGTSDGPVAGSALARRTVAAFVDHGR
jgi:hypothetical protein